MILRALEICNYRSYCGSHKIEFPQPSTDTPIHLIGGYNGAGKTSFLSALSACLFAEEENPKLRASDLTKSPGWDGKPVVRVAAEFSHEGRSFRLARSWTRRAGKSESSEQSMELQSLWEDQTNGDSTTDDDQISEYVRAMFPVEISDFFLFDGEQIQAYTDPKTSGAQVKEALERLLGIHLYKQLSEDLEKIANDIRDERKNVDVSQALNEKAERWDQIEVRLRTIAEERQRLRKAASEIDRKLAELFGRRDKIAGTLDPESHLRRRELDQVRQRIETDIERLRGRVPDLLTGPAALALFAPQLHQADALFRQRDASLDFPRTIGELASFVWDHRESLTAALGDGHEQNEVERLIGNLLLGSDIQSSSPQALNDAAWLVAEMQPDFAELAGVEHRKADLKDRLREVYAELNGLPSLELVDTDLLELSQEIQQHERSKSRIEGDLARLGGEEKNLQEEASLLDSELKKLRRESTKFEQFSSQLELCRKLQEMLVAFVYELTEAKAEELERSLTRKFLKLTNIPQAVEAVEVDRDDYRLSVRFRAASTLEADAASAGQKEVLAFSLIWSLVDMAVKQLPIVIDTLLARLDSIHRRNILRDCFPSLGQQVVILSTDEEIGRDELSSLARFVVSRHHIAFNPDTKSSRVEEGYILD